MYQNQFRKKHFHGKKGGNFNRGKRQFGRRQKTFDPSFLVQTASVAVNVEAKVYEPKNTFANFQLDGRLKQNIVSHGYNTPTPIQDQAIPSLLENKDLVGIARTGSGKTAAFLIPLINKMIKNREEKVLIIAPTRELAVQIRDEFLKFSQNLNIYSCLAIGGVGLHGQIKILAKNPNVVIGTPGRLKDLSNQKKLNLYNFRNIVLDEVDHILDMGFFEDVNYLISKLPKNRQSLFFSATITPKIQSVMTNFLTNPVTIRIEDNAPTTNVNQQIIRIGGKPKIDVLHELLIKKEFAKVLVFGRTKFGIEKLSRELIDRGFKAASIHGNKSQNQRQRALEDFKKNYIQILLATDIASRGLDINDVSHVINYDLPESQEDYIHRIGRTGRAGKLGTAITFIN